MSVNSASGAYSSTTAEKDNNFITKNSLGKDDFIKLLITELRYQDALNPMNDREFISQMAQMSSLEQMQNLNKTMEEGINGMSQSSNNLEEGIYAVLEAMMGQYYFSNFNQGMNLLGREVTYLNEDQEAIQGTVSALKQVNGSYVAVIDEVEVPLTQISLVR